MVVPKIKLTNHFLKRLLIVALAIFAYVFIAKRLISFEYWFELKAFFSIQRINHVFVLFLLFLFILNITSAAKQWHVLIQPYYKIRFKMAIMQYLAGCLSAIGSPARLAEPGGRIVLLPRNVRIDAIVMTSIGGIIQNFVIFLFGFWAILTTKSASIRLYLIELSYTNYIWLILISVISIIVFILVLPLILNNSKIRYWLLKLKKLHVKILFKALTFTLLRYVIYTFQLFICLKLFGLNINFGEFIFLAPIYFFLITLIPSFFLADIGIRGSVSLFVFAQYEEQMPLVLLAVFLLWLLNVLVPAVFGTIVLYAYRDK